MSGPIRIPILVNLSLNFFSKKLGCLFPATFAAASGLNASPTPSVYGKQDKSEFAFVISEMRLKFHQAKDKPLDSWRLAVGSVLAFE